MEQEKLILAMYSGGLDSLGMLYRLLTDREFSSFGLHVHHVHHKNIENRAAAEALTVNLALGRLSSLGFSFEYSESEIGAPVFGLNFMFDIDSINFMAGYISSVNPKIVNIAMGMNANDFSHGLSERRRRADAILAAFTEVKKIYPVGQMSKREIYDMLPSDLRELFWSCRTPKYFSDRVEPCGICRPCTQLREQGIRSAHG